MYASDGKPIQSIPLIKSRRNKKFVMMRLTGNCFVSHLMIINSRIYLLVMVIFAAFLLSLIQVVIQTGEQISNCEKTANIKVQSTVNKYLQRIFGQSKLHNKSFTKEKIDISAQPFSIIDVFSLFRLYIFNYSLQKREFSILEQGFPFPASCYLKPLYAKVQCYQVINKQSFPSHKSLCVIECTRCTACTNFAC